MRRFHSRLCATLVLTTACAYGALAQSQNYPAKSVRFIIPNSAGSQPDVVARMVSERLSRRLGQQFLVENNISGAGLVGAQQAARSPSDGYTLFMGSASAMASNPVMFKSLPYDPVKDFVPVAGLVDNGPFVLAVHPEVPVKNFGEWIALAKSRPGKLSFAADAGLAGIIGRWINKTVGIDVTHIPYKLIATSIQDTAGGRVEMILVSPTAIAPFTSSGKLRIIAITSGKRFPGMENIATVAETLPGFQIGGWFMLTAPTGTPVDITQRLNREVDGFLKEPDTLERFRTFGFTTAGAGTTQSLQEFLRVEQARWAQIAKDVGIEPQ
ncbi:MAG: tripartite tricarboxylate transporter substrate binding protein [Betaproteobacteria bacterium]|nr:tripartite tricarboxylate transporter substrate binding protein [Betaproteobacteria bacterium]